MPAGAEAPGPPGERVRPPGAAPAAADPRCAPCAGLSWLTRLPATSSPSSVSTSPSPSWSCSTASGVTGNRGGGAAGRARLQRAGSGASRPASATSPLGGARPPGPLSGGAARQSFGGRWRASPDRDRSRGQRPAPPSPLPGSGDAGEALRRGGATRLVAEECCLELMFCSVFC